MKKLLICLFMFTALSGIFAAEISKTFEIKYISAEHVYLNGGRNDGLDEGDTLRVIKDGIEVAALKITFVADNSSSCIILNQQQPIKPGDMATAIIRTEIEQSESAETPAEPEKAIAIQPRAETATPESPPFAEWRGKVAFQVYHYDDKNPANLDLTQPTLRLNLTAANLGGRNIDFNLKLRSRQNSRTKAYSDKVEKDEWRNKIYALYFSLGGENSSNRLHFGRIIAKNISGIGYLDGILFEKNISKSLGAGIFAGAQPQWQYADFQTALQKYGISFNYQNGNHKNLRLESSLAIAAEYHSSTVSREFVYLRNFLSIGGRLRLYQTADIDINRDWRKDRIGSSLVLSNLYVSLRYQLTDWAGAGLSFDNRRNYLTYDTRTLDEQLFDDNTRRGLKSDLYLRLPGGFNINGGLGYRKNDSETGATYSYNGGLRKANITGLNLFIGTSITGFSSDATDGLNFSARLGRYFRRGDQLSFEYGFYRYRYAAITSIRNSRWFGFDTGIRLIDNYYLITDYQYNFGDDLDGQQMLAEIGYRF